MKNLMFIVSSLAGGGAERVTVNLCSALCARYDVTLVTLFSNADSYTPDKRVKIVRYSDYVQKKPWIIRKAMKAAGYLPRFIWVRSVKKAVKPAATVSMLSLPNIINAAVSCGDFRIVSERADPEVIGGRYMRYARLAMEGADHVVFQSKRVQNMFPHRIQRKSSVILNPVAVEVRASEQKEKRIVTAGRLTDQKNHRLLIRAFARFSESHPDHVLEIYGSGPLKEDLEIMSAAPELSGRVRLIEFSHDLHERIRSAEMFVLSSDFEGLSNALLEAMMMGLPCISTDCAGSDEVIISMKNGILVPAGDEEALKEAMTRLADDAELRERIADEAQKSSQRFHADTVTDQWIKLIEENS